ncbi:MAG TPA: hypothetical protein P5527_04105 [Kiritimatiellia bacterium]|nr:hypothetical protein [Kiritimatiellia bacterium]
MNKTTPLFVRNRHCVSCDRVAERRAIDCPYCGEQVWHPKAWHVARRCVLLAPVVLAVAATVLLTVSPGWHALFRSLCSAPLAATWLAASGLGLLALPADTESSAAGAKADLRRRQLEAMLGGVVQAFSAVTGALLLAAAPRPSLPILLVGLALLTCSTLLPLFFRIPWCRLAAAAALATAVAVSIL